MRFGASCRSWRCWNDWPSQRDGNHEGNWSSRQYRQSDRCLHTTGGPATFLDNGVCWKRKSQGFLDLAQVVLRYCDLRVKITLRKRCGAHALLNLLRLGRPVHPCLRSHLGPWRTKNGRLQSPRKALWSWRRCWVWQWMLPKPWNFCPARSVFIGTWQQEMSWWQRIYVQRWQTSAWQGGFDIELWLGLSKF